ncbi:hypothetical protein LMG27952_01022 [Paraburkholderia hiiakae]|uniref:Uncharacterized protein n=1 Tax=Paraburkholderia hiiakae TaxID=1081782 RepID=A0ABN7HHC5_9BURK|nr:hypothetical protein LMG27952_01022 [Paraburkholderia hiiakae]
MHYPFFLADGAHPRFRLRGDRCFGKLCSWYDHLFEAFKMITEDFAPQAWRE